MSENVVAYQTVDFSRLPTVDHRFDFRLQERAKRARSPEPNAKTSRPSRKGSSGDRRQLYPGEYVHPIGRSREHIEQGLENQLQDNEYRSIEQKQDIKFNREQKELMIRSHEESRARIPAEIERLEAQLQDPMMIVPVVRQGIQERLDQLRNHESARLTQSRDAAAQRFDDEIRQHEQRLHQLRVNGTDLIASASTRLFRSDVDEPQYRNTARPSSPLTFDNPFRTI